MNLKSFATYAFVLIAAAIAYAPVSVLAQDKAVPAMKIAIINIDAVRAQSVAFKKAGEQFVAYRDRMNGVLEKEQQALRTANAELSRKRTLLSPEAFADERKKYEQRVTEFQRKFQEDQKAIAKLEAEVVGELNRKIIEIIAKYATDNDVSLVLPETVTLLAANSMSINAYALGVLNKELPSVQVKIPAK